MSIRTERVAKLVQQDVADILANELDHELPALFTVTGVRMTRDLSMAYVYVSALGEKGPALKAAFKHLQELAPTVRRALAGRMRHQLRSMPDVKFFYDESLEQANKMDVLLNQIRTEREGREAVHGAATDEAPEADAVSDAPPDADEASDADLSDGRDA